MPSIRTLQVVITGDANSAQRAFNQTEQGATGLQGKLKGVTTAMAGYGKTVAIGLGGVATAFGGMAISAALEGEKATARLENAAKKAGPAFKDLVGTADDLAGKYAKWGFENDEVQLSLAKLAPVTANTADATKKMSLAADIAKARNISLDEATALLVKVQTGHVGLLGRLGITTKDANGHTLTSVEAIQKLSDLYGGQADRTSKTFAGRMDALKAQFHNFAEEVGNVLIPILSSLFGFLADHKEVMIALGTIVGTLLVAAFTAWAVSLFTAGGALAFLLSPIAAVVAAVAAIGVAAYLLWTNWDTVWNWIKDHPAIAIIISILAAPVAAFVLIVGALHWLYENWGTIWPIIQQVLQTVWDGVLAPVLGAIVWAIEAVGTVLGVLRDAWNAAWPTISSVASTAGDIVGGVLGAISWGIGAIKSVLEALRDAWNAIWGPIGDVASTAGSAVAAGLSPIIGILSTIVGMAQTAASALSDLGSFVTGSSGSISDVPPAQRAILKQLGYGAEGGIVTRPTLAMIGEAGPEAIIPLNQMPGASALPGGGGVSTLVIPISIDGRAVTEVVVQNLNTPGGPQIAKRAISNR